MVKSGQAGQTAYWLVMDYALVSATFVLQRRRREEEEEKILLMGGRRWRTAEKEKLLIRVKALGQHTTALQLH